MFNIRNLLLSSVVLVTTSACYNSEGEWCQLEVNQVERREIFKECLGISASARKGVNYTTHDDEDWDSVVSKCGSQATMMSYNYTCGNTQKERWNRAQGIIQE